MFANQVHRFCPRCYRVEQVGQFIEERRLHKFRAGTVDRDDSADMTVDVDTNRHVLEGGRVNVYGDDGQTRATSGNNSDTAVVDS